MRALPLAMTLSLAACAVTPDDAPAITAEYPVPYDALAECVYATTDQKSLGTRFEPFPTMKEMRITEHGGFSTGRIITFRPSPTGGARVEVRVRINASAQFAWFQPAIDACVARLSA